MDGLYKDEEVDVAFVMRCSPDLTSLCIHQHHLSMRLHDECYMVGIGEYILNVLVNGRTQPATWSASFANLKAFALLRGTRSKNITFFLMTKWPLSDGAQIIEDRWKGFTSLILTQYLGKTPSSTWFPGQCRWHANGKATFQGITGVIVHNFGSLSNPVKKPPLCGPFGTRQLRSTNGGLALHWPPSLSNKSIASQTRLNWLDTNVGIAFKSAEHGDGLPLLCMYFVGSWLATMTTSIENHALFGERIPRKLVKTN